MIVLYTIALLILGVVHFLVARRVKSLEKKFSRVSLATTKLASQPLHRQGNGSGRAEVCLAAKQQLELGRLVQQRDRLEDKYFGWKRTSEKVARWLIAASKWKGRKLPYTFGIIDVSMVLYLVDRFGLGQIDLSYLVETVTTLASR